MALHSVTQTQNHEFFVEDGGFPAAGFLDSYARDIAGACERNFNKLGALFGTAQRFGPGNQIRVILDVTLALFGAGAVGQNGGFAEDGGTTIWLAVSGAVFAGRGRDQVLAGIRAAHVAELLEVFLSLRAQNQATLDPGAADGEALSRV